MLCSICEKCLPRKTQSIMLSCTSYRYKKTVDNIPVNNFELLSKKSAPHVVAKKLSPGAYSVGARRQACSEKMPNEYGTSIVEIAASTTYWRATVSDAAHSRKNAITSSIESATRTRCDGTVRTASTYAATPAGTVAYQWMIGYAKAK